MARGKHASASLARRYAELEQDNRDWKRQSAEQKREIHQLRGEVNLMPALRERVQVLEMQLDLATCSEIADLNQTVARLRDEVEEARREKDVIYRQWRKLARIRGALVTSDGLTGQDYEDVAAAMHMRMVDLSDDVTSIKTKRPGERGHVLSDEASKDCGGRPSRKYLDYREAKPLRKDA